MGTKLINIDNNDSVVSVAKIVPNKDDDNLEENLQDNSGEATNE